MGDGNVPMENEMTVPLRQIAEALTDDRHAIRTDIPAREAVVELFLNALRKAFDLGKQAGREEAVGQQQTQEGQELSERIRALSEKPKEG